MYKKHIFFFSILCIVILFVPHDIVRGETRYESKIFTQNTVLRQVNGPYYFEGVSSIPKGVSLTIEKGSQVFIEGSITVRGRLVFQGEEGFPITIKNPLFYSEGISSHPSIQKAITVIGGELSMSHTSIRETGGLVDAYSSSTVLMNDVQIKDVGAVDGPSTITVFNGSVLSIKDSMFENVSSGVGLEIFNQSSISVMNSSLSGVGYQTSILIYDGNNPQNSPSTQSTLFMSDSLIKGKSEAVTVSGVESVHTQKAIEIFNKTYGKVELTTFEGLTGSAISTFSNAYLEISNSAFTKNKVGIESYVSNIHISESEIFGNTEHGAIIYGGEVIATGNWWGSETGPYNIQINPTGNGDSYVGTAGVSPWKQLKPKKKVTCCSNILFIPGIQGSRIYKKNTFTENQLWEPNSNSDISKLYLTNDGYSMDKSLYFRDIIDRTNIALGGNDDIEIYKSFLKSLDGLNVNYSINDWQFAAYDWRMSPNTIVTEGTRYGFNGQYKKMESQIDQMALSSKTGKVTLIAHSYGGLVSKRFLTYLAQRNKIGLIDKVIFVAVPENGSPSALFALLHGDNQDIGGGFIVNKNTMRKFAQNMPSVYSLLPKIDSNLIYGVQATNTISVGVPDINSVIDMYKFLFKEMARPSTIDTIETNVPLVANKKIKQNIDIELGSSFVKPQSDSLYKNIEFYNILGVGVDTLKSIRYVKKPCQSIYTHPWLMSPNCGLDHTPIYSAVGDGTVLAEDVFSIQEQQINPLLNQGGRWGEKYIFNLGEYNRKNNKNYTHANIISTPPIISTLMQIMLNNIGQYSIPAYMTKHGGGRMGGDVSLGEGGENTSITIDNSILSDVYGDSKYRISASDILLMSAKDKYENKVGIYFPLINPEEGTNTKVSVSDIQPIKNSLPNSNFSHVGESYYINSETLPSSVYLKPNQGLIDTVQSAGFILDEIKINFKIEQILPPSGLLDSDGSINQNAQSGSIVLASFENIPITAYSSVEVRIDNSSSTAGLPTVEMRVTNEYAGVYSNTVIYEVNQQYSTSTNVGSPTNSTNQVSYIQDNEPVDILYLISLIRIEIQKSGIRANFKQRYLLKLNAIEKNYKISTESKIRLAKLYSRDTTISLGSIIKDLNRRKSLYYKGGMTRSEAAFLYTQFAQLSRAFGY
ncbi:MAG: hypothetical protein K9M11_04330 [Candidatus Pacebacteria bacterium]|nr:hypothetical protein [Candidatus Paceibacterota bacterium]